MAETEYQVIGDPITATESKATEILPAEDMAAVQAVADNITEVEYLSANLQPLADQIAADVAAADATKSDIAAMQTAIDATAVTVAGSAADAATSANTAAAQAASATSSAAAAAASAADAAAAGGGGGGIGEAPLEDGPWGRQGATWVLAAAPGPADGLTTAQVGGIQAAATLGPADRVAVLSDVAGGLSPTILAALNAAISPSGSNPFATLTDLSGSGGGTTLAPAIVDALNASVGAGPSTSNAYALISQVPANSGALPAVRLTLDALRTLRIGAHTFPSAGATNHPVLGSVGQANLAAVLGTAILMPVAVAAVLVKEGRSYLIVTMEIDQQSGTYVPVGYLWTDDNTLAGTVEINTVAQPKSIFRSMGHLVANQLLYFERSRLTMQAAIDELTIDPANLPVPEGNLTLALLYEPYAVIDDPAGGINVFDTLTHYVQIAWFDEPDPAVVAGKEAFTRNGTTYGHLRDGVGGPFILLSKILDWLADGRILQVARDVTDPNIANLCVLRAYPLPGAAGGQALTRDGSAGLLSVNPADAAQYALFRDGTHATPGRLAYKDGATTKYPQFIGEVPDVEGEVDNHLIGISAGAVTTSPLAFAVGHAGKVTDLDLTAFAANGIMNVNINNDLVAPPAGQAYAAWFWTKGITDTKKVKFNIVQSGAPPLLTTDPVAYRRRVSGTDEGLAWDPDDTTKTPRIGRQPVTIPAGNNTVVRFVFFAMGRTTGSAFQLPLGALEGLTIEGVNHPWDVIQVPPTGMLGPHVMVYDHVMGNLASSTILQIWPKTTNIEEVKPFSRWLNFLGFFFVFSSTQLQGDPVSGTAQSLPQAAQFTAQFTNVDALTRAVYIICRRNNTNDIPLTVNAASVNLHQQGSIVPPATAAFEMRYFVGQELAVIGANTAIVDSIGNSAWGAAYSFGIRSDYVNDFVLEGPSEVNKNHSLIPVIYDHFGKKIRICA